MPATIYPGVNSIVLNVQRPYEDDEVTPRDDLIGMKVWCSTAQGFNPLDEFGAVVVSPMYDGPSINCVLSGLTSGTTYYVRYALISEIDPLYIGLSEEMSTSPITEMASEAAEVFWLLKNTSVVTKRADGAMSPASLTISARYKIGSGEPAQYLGRLSVSSSQDGATYTDVYTSSQDEASCTIPVPALADSLRIRLFSEGGGALLDEETIPVIPEPVAYEVKLESTNGTQFRVGQSSTSLLIARVFRNGTEVTDQIHESKFQWKRVSLVDPPFPNDDNSWNGLYQSGYKQVQINVDEVNSRATFHCYIVE